VSLPYAQKSPWTLLHAYKLSPSLQGGIVYWNYWYFNSEFVFYYMRHIQLIKLPPKFIKAARRLWHKVISGCHSHKFLLLVLLLLLFSGLHPPTTNLTVMLARWKQAHECEIELNGGTCAKTGTMYFSS
jgi:hypothetical protein